LLDIKNAQAIEQAALQVVSGQSVEPWQAPQQEFAARRRSDYDLLARASKLIGQPK